MRERDRFPHAVDEIEHAWIPMGDGCRLAARLWRPVGVGRAPAILEMNPYGKRAGTRDRDERMHRWFAGHGYVCVRLDVRGTGDSEGRLEDEYTERQQQDGADAVAWVAAQPWCDGAVGLIGKSWGGIAALQIAAHEPPALRAVIAVCATDDRWMTDAHWMGGVLLCENLSWGAMLMATAAAPPDPEVVGANWRAQWLERLDAIELWPALWMRHSTPDDYWKNGSVARDLARIACPVYVVSGWADGYADAVPRLLAGLRAPRKGLVGPWSHEYPHEAAAPGPAIGFLQECKRWWDEWLRGEPTGTLNEPVYRVWMQEHPRAGARLDGPGHGVTACGRWVAEGEWPSSRIEYRAIDVRAPDSSAPPTRSPQTVGRAAVPWCCFGFEPEFWPNQAADDAESLVLETAPLASQLEILGAPRVRLQLRVDRPTPLVVRLCDVAPNGDAVRVSYGVVQVSDAASDLVTLELQHAAYAFLPGHRVRFALSTAYWPVVWPAAEAATVEIDPARSTLELPVRAATPLDATLAEFEPAEVAASDARQDLDAFAIEVSQTRDGAESVHRARIEMDASGGAARSFYPAVELEVGHGIVEEFRIRPDDPTSARCVLRHALQRRRGDFHAQVELELRVTADAKSWLVEATLAAHDAHGLVRERRWSEAVPRAGPRPGRADLR